MEATVRVEVVKLLDQLQQLLVGICLIQVGYCGHPQVHFLTISNGPLRLLYGS